MPAATIRTNPGSTPSEKVPRSLVSDSDIALATLLNSTSTTSAVASWWPSEAGAMEGVAAGSLLPFRWKSALDQRALIPAGAESPIKARDTAIGADYLQLGYGASLTRRTLTLAHLRLVSGGTGYAVGDTITLQNGVVVTVTAVSGGVVSSSSDTVTGMPTGFTITNKGSFSSRPTTNLTQVSTSGSGSGATFNPSMAAQNGSLILETNLKAWPTIPANGVFSYFVVARVPVVGGVAGSDPGGIVVSAALNQSEITDSTANNRTWGLRINAAGYAQALLNGDATSIQDPSDVRDGQWHVYLVTMNPTGSSGSDSATLWRDGVKKASLTGYTAINGLPGALVLRVGATGLVASGPTNGAALDFAACIPVPLNLAASANDAIRQFIGNQLLAKWRGSGSWA